MSNSKNNYLDNLNKYNLFSEDYTIVVDRNLNLKSEEQIRYLMMKLNYSRTEAEKIVLENRYEEVIKENDI